jgi:hypothetical protein
VNAYVNGTRVRAFPDSGSALNIVSLAYVRHNSLQIVDNTQRALGLPNGMLVQTSGNVNVMFRFADELRSSIVNFTILAGCIYDFVLSESSLQASKTLTTFKERIRREPVHRPIARVCLQGIPQQQIRGSINGLPRFRQSKHWCRRERHPREPCCLIGPADLSRPREYGTGIHRRIACCVTRYPTRCQMEVQ